MDIGFFSLLGIVFITLKLCGVINWEWWIVTIPLWGGLALSALLFAVAIIFYCLGWVLDKAGVK